MMMASAESLPVLTMPVSISDYFSFTNEHLFIAIHLIAIQHVKCIAFFRLQRKIMNILFCFTNNISETLITSLMCNYIANLQKPSFG